MKNIKVFRQDDKLVIHKRTDPNPSLASVRVARDMQDAIGVSNPFAPSESWHIGRIDTHVIELWCKEAGIAYNDREARAELIKRKMLSGEFEKFRVKGGTY